MATWRAAKESVDARIEALGRELIGFDDPDLVRIGELGLFGVTGKETVALTASLMDFERVAPPARDAAASALRASIRAYRKAIEASKIVKLVDEAPFDTKVDLRATMFAALGRIESGLAAG